MRALKNVIPLFLLTIWFMYGFCVGRYRWFPSEQLAVIKRTLSQEKKVNNDSLLAELAKTNNIQFNDSLKVLNSISSSKKSNYLQFISFGDYTFKDKRVANGNLDDIVKRLLTDKITIGQLFKAMTNSDFQEKYKTGWSIKGLLLQK